MAVAPESPDLTGEARFRRTLFGRLVLEVEAFAGLHDPAVKGRKTHWRAASYWDLAVLRKVRARKGLEPLL